MKKKKNIKKQRPRLTNANCPVPKTRMIDKVGYNRKDAKKKFDKDLQDLGL